MGTVHAKVEVDRLGEAGVGGLLGLDEPLGDDPLPKPTIQLNGVRARVDRVHVDGLSRTKDDIVRATVDDLFHATDFEDVILRAHRVRRALDSLGCFREIGVSIDVSSGPQATPEGLEVTFEVSELSRVVGGVNTTVSENEGNLVLGVKLPNVLGRGERLQAEYAVGHRSSSNFTVTANKPLPHNNMASVLSTSVYQQTHEYPTSGYRLLDRGLLCDLAFATSHATKHNLQWEGVVRDTAVLSKATSFRVRESSGPQMKSILRHIVSVDHRDEPIFPTRGTWLQFTSEVSGLGGGVAYLKTELQGQANVALYRDIVLQACGGGGVLHDVFGTEIPDHCFLGGPTSLRGFRQRGVGPHCDGQATGGKMWWVCSLHVFAPLPFARAGGPLADLFRSHAFVAAGCLAMPEESRPALEALSAVRVSCGAGVSLRLGRAARLELNYCVPLRARAGDQQAPGIQFGVGANFMWSAYNTKYNTNTKQITLKSPQMTL